MTSEANIIKRQCVEAGQKICQILEGTLPGPPEAMLTLSMVANTMLQYRAPGMEFEEALQSLVRGIRNEYFATSEKPKGIIIQ